MFAASHLCHNIKPVRHRTKHLRPTTVVMHQRKYRRHQGAATILSRRYTVLVVSVQLFIRTGAFRCSSFESIVKQRNSAMHRKELALKKRFEVVQRSNNSKKIVLCADSRIDEIVNDNEIDFSSVSDEEALLACHAYLQRKNRLGGWTERKRRKQLEQQTIIARDLEWSPSSIGYFWENLDTLKSTGDDDDDAADEGEEEEDDDDDYDSDSDFSSSVMDSFSTTRPDPRDFTKYPMFPPEETVRRSNAAKKKWKDPEWKAMWYEKRWGSSQNRRDPQLINQKIINKRVSSLPPALLESPEFASLTNEEVTEAVRTYVSANRKRSKTRQNKIEKEQAGTGVFPSIFPERTKKELLKQSELPEDALLDSPNLEATARDNARKRSERSVKAYKTRLANIAEREQTSGKQKKSTMVDRRLPSGNTPREALIRIEAALDGSKLPSSKDVELMIRPLKLGRRKDLLRRILSEHFYLRGKCIPADMEHPDNDDLPKKFVTQCTMAEIGAFVLWQMKNGV